MTPVKKTYSGIELLCFYATFRHSDLTFSYVVTNITQKYVWAIFWIRDEIFTVRPWDARFLGNEKTRAAQNRAS